MLLFKIKLTREEQVGLVSSEAAYRRVVESFQEETLDTFFIKDQLSVYKWRKAFFLKHFQAGSWRTDCNFLCTAGMCEENHYEAAIHYNILHNFDTVMNLAFTLQKPNVFFPSDFFCTHVNSKYDLSNHSDSEIVSQLYKVEFSCAIHLLCGHFSSSSPSLREVAIRRVLELGLETRHLPKTLKDEAARGLYHKVIMVGNRELTREAWNGMEEGEKPSHLSERGVRILEKFLAEED